WDLRHDAPNAFVHSFEINANPGLTPTSPEGALVTPGSYSLRLTVEGRTMTRPVTVRNDPRSHATTLALSLQHSLQSRIATLMDASWSDEQEVSAIRESLTRIASSDAADDLKSASSALRLSLDSIAGAEASGPGRGGAGGAGGPTFRSINNSLAGQLNAQDNGDMAPTAGMNAAAAASCLGLSRLESKLRRISTSGLAAVNAVLTRHGTTTIPSSRMSSPARCA
ncbi:MAG: hypothetical protein ABIT38_18200, partial [Gemmatimonadaceae bacterium]